MKYSDQIRFVAERLDKDMEGSLVYAIDKLGELTADLRKMKTGEIPLNAMISGPEALVEREPALGGAESPETHECNPETDESNPDRPGSEDIAENLRSPEGEYDADKENHQSVESDEPEDEDTDAEDPSAGPVDESAHDEDDD